MEIAYHNNLRKAERVTASRVVVYDNYGNPLAVVMELDNGQYLAVTASHKRFNEVLKQMGIN